VIQKVNVLTHGRPEQTGEALEALRAAASAAGVELVLDPAEIGAHGRGDAEIVDLSAPTHDDISLCIALGGDGTILRALRRYAATPVPVFAVNFGEIGFLATVEPHEVEEWFPRALAGDFDILTLPALGFTAHGDRFVAVNDLAVMRKAGERVANLAYVVGEEEVGSVRSDGLVVSTPVGSTGYNLANAGPVMAWGVEGFAVSFVAPHSLTARALVVAPGDPLEIHNRGRKDVDVFVDGRAAGSLGAGDCIRVHFVRDICNLAQKPGSSFYHRLAERFGRLAA
jgi:NAD+ kinase